MRVRAIAKGYMGRLYYPGDEFTVEDGRTGSWFEPIEAPAKPAAPKGGKGKAAKPDAPKPETNGQD